MEWNLKSVDEVLLDLELTDYDDYLIDGIVSSSVTTILGDPYLGKTYLAIDVARSLTTGEPFLGRPVNRQVDRVAFLCTDPGGNITVAQRVSKAGLDGRRVLTQQFYPPESWQEWQDAVGLFMRERVGAIVVDNTTDIAGDANDPRDVKKVTDGLRLWSDNGATILNLHHRNKGGGYFGSSLWRKWTRAELELSGRPKTQDRRLQSIANDVEPLDLQLKFRYSESPAFTVVSERKIVRDPETLDQNARVAAWLRTHPGLSQREAASQMSREFDFSVSQKRVSRVVQMGL